MFIYVDESGSFVHRRAGNVIDCVGAVVIPERDAVPLLAAFAALPLPRDEHGEVKGSKLEPDHFSAVVELLFRYADVLVFVEAIDMSLTTPARLDGFRRGQAEGLVKHVPAYATTFVKTSTAQWRSDMLALPDQLLVQLILLSELADSVMRWAEVYYAIQYPPALCKFAWRIDPKQAEDRTPYERLWMELVPGWVQARSMRDPQLQLEEGDYSHMSRFMSEETECPEHLKPHRKFPDRPWRSTNVGQILAEDRAFPDSKTSVGVQLADVVVNAVRRAFNDQLPWNVARHLARLVMRAPGDRSPICVLDDGSAMPRETVHAAAERMAREIVDRHRCPIAPL